MENYEGLLLESLFRLQKLESKVEELEEIVRGLKAQPSVSESINDDDVDMTRSRARDIVIDKIRGINNNLRVRKATREEGSGIVIETNNNNIKIKYYYSKSHELVRPISWNAINKKDITGFDFFVFSILHDGRLYSLVFNNVNLLKLIKEGNKETDPNNRYHFSFVITNEAEETFKCMEVRGAYRVDVTYTLNKFDYWV